MRNASPRLVLLLVVTVATGAVDALSYLGLERVFTANMTGNVAFLGFAAGGASTSPVGNGVALAGFVLGAIGGGRLGRRAWASDAHHAGNALLAEALVLAAATVVATGDLHATATRLVVTLLLALAMGWQTALARQLAIADVNTTVITMTLASLAADTTLARGDAARWRRRVAVIVALAVGAAIGALLMRVEPWLALAFATAVVAASSAVAPRALPR